MERLLANEPEPEPLPEELQPGKPEDHNQNNLKNHSQKNLKSHKHDKQAMRYLIGAIVGYAELRQPKKIASAAQTKRHASSNLIWMEMFWK